MNMESSAGLALSLFALFTIFLPLLWTWIRVALLIADKLAHQKLGHPSAWLLILDIIPLITISMLLGMMGCASRYLIEHNELSDAYFFAFLVFFLICVFTFVWILLRGEIVTMLHRRGM